MVAVLAAAELLVADAIQVVRMFLPSQWGIFTMSGSPVITGKVLGVAYRKSWRTADFPVEQNSFASYNKAEEPWEARVQFAVDGSTPLGSYLIGPIGATANRRQVLAKIEAACSTIDLFAVSTPEWIYPSASLVHMDYERRARGATSMIVLDVGVQQVRIAPAPAFTNVKSPDGADAQNGGAPQATSPTPDQQQSIPTPAAPPATAPAPPPSANI